MKGEKFAFVVGSGAVQNAWAPVVRALQQLYSFPITNDCANSILARLIYLLRWQARINTKPGEEQFLKLKKYLTGIRKEICRELNEAQQKGEIKVRDEFGSIVDHFFPKQDVRRLQFMLVTTNWDTVVPDALAKRLGPRWTGTFRPLHIHGSIADSETLYLPTEVTKEPYRSEAEDQEIGGLHGSIMRGLESASRCIVYGLSLSPLDAELNQTLAAGWDNSVLTEIVIVAPNHDIVAQRVRLLLNPKHKIRVLGCTPSRLDEVTDYTAKK